MTLTEIVRRPRASSDDAGPRPAAQNYLLGVASLFDFFGDLVEPVPEPPKSYYWVLDETAHQR